MRQARRLLRRRDRERLGRFLAEGPQAVREALAAGAVVELFATHEGMHRSAGLVAAADRADVPVRAVDEDALAALSETVNPQGVVAICRLLGRPLAQVLVPSPRLVAVLARVRDPGNAGAVVRCADAAGADAAVVTADSVDVHNGKAVRASAGSVFHVPLALGADLAAATGAARAVGCTVLFADGGGDVDLFAAEQQGLLARPVAWTFGNEAWGAPAEDLALADAVVRVPILGRAESLNLATAAAVCLYATARAQRRAAPPP